MMAVASEHEKRRQVKKDRKTYGNGGSLRNEANEVKTKLAL